LLLNQCPEGTVYHSPPLKPSDRHVTTSIDQPFDYVTLQKFPPLTDWSSSTTIKVKAKMMDL